MRADVDVVIVRRASGQAPASIMADRIFVLFKGDAPQRRVATRQPTTA
jgi:hypothetical protein